jgi:hypothetical protein
MQMTPSISTTGLLRGGGIERPAPGDTLSAAKIEPSPAQWCKLTGDTIKQQLSAMPRLLSKNVPAPEKSKESAHTRTRSANTSSSEESAIGNPEDQRVVVSGSKGDGSGQHSSDQDDGGQDEQRGGSHSSKNLQRDEKTFTTGNKPAVRALEAPAASVKQVIGTKAHHPFAVQLKPNPAQKANFRSASVAVLIKSLLHESASDAATSAGQSLRGKAHLTGPKAGPKERRRIRQALEVADCIVMIGNRACSGDSDKHPGESVIDALIDLLFLLIDLLTPVIDLIDPSTRQAALSQLSFLADKTRQFDALSTAFNSTMSLFEDSAG